MEQSSTPPSSGGYSRASAPSGEQFSGTDHGPLLTGGETNPQSDPFGPFRKWLPAAYQSQNSRALVPSSEEFSVTDQGPIRNDGEDNRALIYAHQQVPSTSQGPIPHDNENNRAFSFAPAGQQLPGAYQGPLLTSGETNPQSDKFGPFRKWLPAAYQGPIPNDSQNSHALVPSSEQASATDQGPSLILLLQYPDRAEAEVVAAGYLRELMQSWPKATVCITTVAIRDKSKLDNVDNMHYVMWQMDSSATLGPSHYFWKRNGKQTKKVADFQVGRKAGDDDDEKVPWIPKQWQVEALCWVNNTGFCVPSKLVDHFAKVGLEFLAVRNGERGEFWDGARLEDPKWREKYMAKPPTGFYSRPPPRSIEVTRLIDALRLLFASSGGRNKIREIVFKQDEMGAPLPGNPTFVGNKRGNETPATEDGDSSGRRGWKQGQLVRPKGSATDVERMRQILTEEWNDPLIRPSGINYREDSPEDDSESDNIEDYSERGANGSDAEDNPKNADEVEDSPENANDGGIRASNNGDGLPEDGDSNLDDGDDYPSGNDRDSEEGDNREHRRTGSRKLKRQPANKDLRGLAKLDSPPPGAPKEAGPKDLAKKKAERGKHGGTVKIDIPSKEDKRRYPVKQPDIPDSDFDFPGSRDGYGGTLTIPKPQKTALGSLDSPLGPGKPSAHIQIRDWLNNPDHKKAGVVPLRDVAKSLKTTDQSRRFESRTKERREQLKTPSKPPRTDRRPNQPTKDKPLPTKPVVRPERGIEPKTGGAKDRDLQKQDAPPSDAGPSLAAMLDEVVQRFDPETDAQLLVQAQRWAGNTTQTVAAAPENLSKIALEHREQMSELRQENLELRQENSELRQENLELRSQKRALESQLLKSSEQMNPRRNQATVESSVRVREGDQDSRDATIEQVVKELMGRMADLETKLAQQSSRANQGQGKQSSSTQPQPSAARQPPSSVQQQGNQSSTGKGKESGDNHGAGSGGTPGQKRKKPHGEKKGSADKRRRVTG
ncbi:hypothetical protein VTJ49DRAFT_6495 [Mycothermus thermophilus]|uniref:Uncharacterized protein n=1 Tax=Humicola insolens TaxID=85995 RepID=A0ABR3V186_HUMIN